MHAQELVGWGNNVHIRLQTHALSWGRALVGWGGVGWVRVTFSAVMLIVFLAVRLVLRVALWAARIRQNGPPHVVSL